MTQKEIIEGNKILMKFLELNNINTEYDEGNIAYGKSGDGLSFNAYRDYNDLMRVWFKFKELDISIMLPIQILKYKYLKDCAKEYLVNGGIENLFLLLVKAVRWYNSTKLETNEN